MPIKNDTATVLANRSIAEIRHSLIKHGGTGAPYEYEQGTGRLEAFQCLLQIKNQDVAFSLPVHRQRLQRVLALRQVRRWEEEYGYRVAWRNIRDWVMAQLVLSATEIVDMPAISLPFATDTKGQTPYEKTLEGKFLRGPRLGEDATRKTRHTAVHRVP